MKPLDPRLLSTARSARHLIVGMAAISVLNVALTWCFAWNLSTFITDVFINHSGLSGPINALIWAAAAGLARAFTLWAQEWLGAVAAANAKSELRHKLLDSIEKLGGPWVYARGTAPVRSLVTEQIDSLDSYFAKFLPQLVFTVVITPLFTLLIFSLDRPSGWSLLFTLPLIPIFMILIGWATQGVQARQLEALNRLTNHFSEALRGLTTLRVFGRAENQILAISKSSQQYKARTMKVLRLSFLSGFALELIASLSVALIAVSIGLRLVSGEISLAVGLFVLLLAPEAYLPLRMVGAQFHTAAEGVEASKAILDIIDEAAQPRIDRISSADQLSTLALSGFEAIPGQLVVVQGPSGAGKTTRLNQLRQSLDADSVAWLPQRSSLVEGTVLDNIVGRGVTFSQVHLNEALRLASVDELSLEQRVGDGSRGISGGQAQRITLARAIYAALDRGRNTLLLDEPISGQDAERAAKITAGLLELAARGYAILAISHQPIFGAHRTLEVRIV